MTSASGPDSMLAGAHGPEVEEPKARFIPAPGKPPAHPAAMTINAVPHYLRDETTDLFKTLPPVELCHANGHLIAALLAEVLPGVRLHEVGLAAAGAEPRLGFHAPQEGFEVPRWKLDVQIELAQVFIIDVLSSRIAGIKSFHDSWPHAAPAAVLAADHLDGVMSCRIFSKNGRGRIH